MNSFNACRFYFDQSPVLMWATDSQGNRTFVNEPWKQLTGLSDHEALQEEWKKRIHPHDLPRCEEVFRVALESRQDVDAKYRLLTASGEYRWVHDEGRPLIAEDGSPLGFMGTCTDITERMNWEASLRSRDDLIDAVTTATKLLLTTPDYHVQVEHCLALVGEAAGVDRAYIFQNHPHPESGLPLMSQRHEWVRTGVSPQINNARLQNLSYDDGFGRLLRLLQAGRPYEGLVREFPIEEQALLEGQNIQALFCAPIVVRNELWGFVGFDDCHSERKWSPAEGSILFALAGSLGAAIERRATDKILQARDRLLQGVAKATHLLLATPDFEESIRAALAAMGSAADVERVYIFENKHASHAHGRSMTERFVWHKGERGARETREDMLSYDELFPRWFEILATGKPISGYVQDFLTDEPEPERGMRQILLVPIMLDNQFWGFLGFDDGNLQRHWNEGDESILKAVAGSLGGAIARQRAHEALRQSENLLRHSQKMDAVGRLAGGVAHDFNNLLTAITGYGEIVLRKLRADHPFHHEIKEICRAAERAHSLTRQLLAFSRKQVLEPRIVNLNTIVIEMEKLLQRLIGEHVELRTETQPDAGVIRVDPGQIEQVIINLAVNARDAMPDGGRLTLRTSRTTVPHRITRDHLTVEPGDYVTFTITDTGVGMDDYVKAHIFEPFFTTKEVGKGTGLGLSIVYGIIQQSGGSILFESAKGRGTEFVIYLPVAADATSVEPGSGQDDVQGGRETILLVEDETIVRELSERILEESGYHVLTARNGREAMSLFTDHPDVQLLLTDVVMPHVSGRALAQRLTGTQPQLKVLYMSGYAEDMLHGLEDLTRSRNFLEKPFTPGTLVRKVREVLDDH